MLDISFNNVLVFISYLLFAPILTFLHEIGHAFFALLFTNKEVSIMLGAYKKTGYRLKIKRLTIYYNKFSFFTGFYHYSDSPTGKFKKLLIILGGPIVSIIMALIFWILVINSSEAIIKSVFTGGFWVSLIQTFMTVLPMKYIHAGYTGFKSDGLQALEVIRGER